MNLQEPSPEELVKEIMRKAIDRIKQIEADIERLQNPRKLDFVPPGFANPQTPVARRFAIMEQRKLIKNIRQEALNDAAKAIEKSPIDVQLKAFKHTLPFDEKKATPLKQNRDDITNPQPSRINLNAAYMNKAERHTANKEKMDTEQDYLMDIIYEKKAKDGVYLEVSEAPDLEENTENNSDKVQEKFKGATMSKRFDMKLAYPNFNNNIAEMQKDKGEDYEPER